MDSSLTVDPAGPSHAPVQSSMSATIFGALAGPHVYCDLPGLRRFSASSESPPDPPPVLTDDEIQESREAVVARLERMVKQDSATNDEPPPLKED